MSQQVQWISPNGATLTFSTAEGAQYRFTKKYDGFSKHNTDHQCFQSPLQDGITPVHTRIAERHISFEVIISCPQSNLVLLESLVLQMVQAFYPQPGTGTLIYTQESGKQYGIACRGSNTPNLSMGQRGPTWQQVTIDLIAFWPYWVSTTPTIKSLNSFTGGFQEPIGTPFDFGLATETETVVNGGDVPTPAVITFNGSITNPRLDNLTTGEYISITKTLGSGEQLIITTGPGSPSVRYIHGGVNDNGFQYIDDDTIFFMLQPGNNILDFSASAAVGTDAAMTIEYYDQFSGV